MGVVHKLRPEIRDYILEQKKTQPILSCRGLTALIQNRFNLQVSKSSINAIIKEFGLSMPVGRRAKKIRRRPYKQPEPFVDVKPGVKATATTKELPQVPAKPTEESVKKTPETETPLLKKPDLAPVEKPGQFQPEIKIEKPAKETPAKEPGQILPEITKQPVKAEPPAEMPVKEPIETVAEKPSEVTQPISAEQKAEVKTGGPKEEPVKESAEIKESVKTPLEAPPKISIIIEPGKTEIPVEPKAEKPGQAPLREAKDKSLEGGAPLTPEKPAEEIIAKKPVGVTPETPVSPKEEAKIEPAKETPAKEPVKAPAEQIAKIIPEKQAEIIPELPKESSCTGAILLKAMDYLIGGAHNIAENLKNLLGRLDSSFLAKTEYIIYASLFSNLPQDLQAKAAADIEALIARKITPQDMAQHLNELQTIKSANSDMLRVIINMLQEVHCIEVAVSDGNVLYLDSQFHAVWSTHHIPYDFSNSLYNTKNYINKFFYEKTPLVLFMAPGYDIPTKEFLNLITSLDYANKKISRLTLYGNKPSALETIHFEQSSGRSIIFGLWPWQFIEYRKIKKIGEFKQFYFEMLKKNLYLAEAEIEISPTEPSIKQPITLRGCALKTNPTEKTRLVILSNIPYAKLNIADMAAAYLNHWPNLEETFQDLTRKIELFTYTADSQRYFSTETLNLDITSSYTDMQQLFNNYLMALDLYFRWHILPSGYENKSFEITRERFYNLRTVLKRQDNYTDVFFHPPEGYQFLKELEYACRRLNEREIIFTDGKRLWFLVER